MFLCMHVWLIVFPSSIMINSLQSSMILRIRKLHFHFLERSKSKLPACQVWAWFCHCGVCRWFLQVGILFFFKAKAQFFIFNNFWKSKFSIEFTFLHYIDQIIANEIAYIISNKIDLTNIISTGCQMLKFLFSNQNKLLYN